MMLACKRRSAVAASAFVFATATFVTLLTTFISVNHFGILLINKKKIESCENEYQNGT